MNVHNIVGNLGADPEVRQTGSGKSVCDLSVATSYRYKNSEGDWVDGTDWHKVTVWGGQADACGKYLTKGSKVAVTGRVTTEKWEDKDGNTRYTTKTIADRVEFLGSKSDSGDRREPRREREEPPPRRDDRGSRGRGRGEYQPDYDDDSIPF